jgi:hypothetical protein
MRLRVAVLLGALAALAPAGEVLAQAGSCELTRNREVERRTERGASVIEIRGPLEFLCGGGVVIRAEHGLLFEATRLVELTGSVSYQDPERRLTSQRATYASTSGRLHATGSVVLVDLQGRSTLRGPELEYYRVLPGRPEVLAHATGRPHLELHSRPGEGGEMEEPYLVDADHMTLRGEQHVTATGRVEIHRSDLEGRARRAVFDGARDLLELDGEASLVGERFRLSGGFIQARTPGGALEEVLARGAAVLEGEGTRVRGPILRLHFAAEQLERLVASGVPAPGETRPTVDARGFRIEADSVDARSPDQRLELVVAIGNARGESVEPAEGLQRDLAMAPREAGQSSLLVGLGSHDWILGDTIEGHFEPGDPTAEGAGDEVELRRVVSRGSARSLYRINDAARPEQPSLNYLSGEAIELTLRDGELDRATVTGLLQGMMLEPERGVAGTEGEAMPTADAGATR